MDGLEFYYLLLFFVGIALCILITRSILSMDYFVVKKFKKKNPQAATIWIACNKGDLIRIIKIDGSKTNSLGMGTVSKPNKTYILPGSHVLTLRHYSANPDGSKRSKRIITNFSELKVNIDPKQDYTLLYNEQPDQYSLVEGMPQVS